jgi:hypothetical protein
MYGASATLTAGAETGRFRVQVDLPAHVPAAKQSSPPAEIHAGAHR